LSSWNIPDDLNSYQAIADRFVEDHPGTSVAVEVTTGDFHQWFITRLAADLAPDIIRITPQQIGRYAANGSLVDLTPAIPDDYQQDWSDSFWAIGDRARGCMDLGAVPRDRGRGQEGHRKLWLRLRLERSGHRVPLDAADLPERWSVPRRGRAHSLNGYGRCDRSARFRAAVVCRRAGQS